MVNMIKQNTVTEYPFLRFICCRGYFRESAWQVFLLWLNEHRVGKFDEDRCSTFWDNWSAREPL